VGGSPGGARDEAMLTGPPPDVTGRAGTLGREAFEAAQAACEELLPEGAVMFGGPGGPTGAGVDASAFRAYTSCMADHGVELPEPGEGAAPPVRSDRDGSDEAPELEAALEACGALLPDVTQTVPPTSAA
jgi:hypothetical protein